MSETLELQVGCEERLAVLVRERTGLRILDHQLANLRRTVTDACRLFGYASCSDYLTALEQSRPDSPVQEHLIAGITVGESYFFRDQGQMDFLQQHWLPSLIERRRGEGQLNLRIWSAGCADGQEIYSIAMTLHELLPDIEQWNLHLLGTDINIGALSRALRGRYRSWSMRAVDEQRQQRFFCRKDEFWEIERDLRRLAGFSYLNLHGDSYPSILSQTNAMDLILCRNVFIYFDPEIVEQVMEKFHDCLSTGGCLLLGATDLVDMRAARGFAQHLHGDTLYLLRGEERAASSEPPRLLKLWPAPQTAEPEVSAQTPAERTPAALRERVQPYAAIVRLLAQGDWSEALAAIEIRAGGGDDSALIWQFRGKALANLGRVREALRACEESIQRDSTDKHSHFIMALVLTELKRLSQAEGALRRTLYLDHRFLEAHYQLGLLQLRRGDRSGGLKSLRNALRIASEADPAQPLHDAAGMTHGRIAAILRNELQIFEAQESTGRTGGAA